MHTWHLQGLPPLARLGRPASGIFQCCREFQAAAFALRPCKTVPGTANLARARFARAARNSSEQVSSKDLFCALALVGESPRTHQHRAEPMQPKPVVSDPSGMGCKCLVCSCENPTNTACKCLQHRHSNRQRGSSKQDSQRRCSPKGQQPPGCGCIVRCRARMRPKIGSGKAPRQDRKCAWSISGATCSSRSPRSPRLLGCLFEIAHSSQESS